MTSERMTIPQAIKEVQQIRTNWQLAHSVIGQFATPELQFRQCCLELQDMEYKLAYAELATKKSEAEIAKLEATGDPVDAVQADMHKLELKMHELAVLGAEREVAALREIFNQMPHFTLAEIDAAQPREYELRKIEIGNPQHLMELNALDVA